VEVRLVDRAKQLAKVGGTMDDRAKQLAKVGGTMDDRAKQSADIAILIPCRLQKIQP